MFVAGDLKEITFNHPTLGSGTIYPKANEDGTIRKGGFISDDDDSGATSSGQMIDKMTNTRWSVEATCAWDNQVNLELDVLKGLQESTELAEWTFTHVSGTVWGGLGKPVGDIEGSTANATFTLKVAGGGKLAKVA